MKTKSRKHSSFELYVFGMLLALELIMSFTFLGYIHLDPISITTAYIPIVVAGCLFDPLASTICGAVFGLGSLYKASALYVVSADRVFSPVQSGNPFGSIMLSVGSRALFGFIIGLLFALGRKSGKYYPLWSALSALLPGGCTPCWCTPPWGCFSRIWGLVPVRRFSSAGTICSFPW